MDAIQPSGVGREVVEKGHHGQEEIFFSEEPEWFSGWCLCLEIEEAGGCVYMEVSTHGGTPLAGWFIMENPAKMDDELGGTSILGNLHILIYAGSKQLFLFL